METIRNDQQDTNERRDTVTDKQFMEQLAAEAAGMTPEEKAYVLGTVRGMGMMRKAQPEEQAKPNEKEETAGGK